MTIIFCKQLYPIGGTMSCSLPRYMVCYYLASVFVLSLDSNIIGLHVNLLPGWTSIEEQAPYFCSVPANQSSIKLSSAKHDRCQAETTSRDVVKPKIQGGVQVNQLLDICANRCLLIAIWQTNTGTSIFVELHKRIGQSLHAVPFENRHRRIGQSLHGLHKSSTILFIGQYQVLRRVIDR